MIWLVGLLIVGFILAVQRGRVLAQGIGFVALAVCIVVSLLWMLGLHLI